MYQHLAIGLIAIVFTHCSRANDAPPRAVAGPETAATARDAHAAQGADSATTATGTANALPATTSADAAGSAGAAAAGSAGAAAAPVPASNNKIAITVEPVRKQGIAERCAIAGAPLLHQRFRLAVDSKQRIYISSGNDIHRFTLAATGPCVLEVDKSYGKDGVFTVPPPPPAKQPLGNKPIFLRSGDAEWYLSKHGDAVYAADYINGVMRIDRGKVENACPALRGLRTFASLGTSVTGPGTPATPIDLKRCRKADASSKIRDAFAAGNAVWLAEMQKITIVDRTGKTQATLGNSDTFAPDGFCAIVGISDCGDGHVCVLDGNCAKVAIYSPTGEFIAKIGRELFGAPPYGYYGIAADQAGNALLLVGHKAEANKAEAAVYRVPASEL